MSKGIVYLVGAGPGDPGLITIKGKECVRKADVIVYDYLVSSRLLAQAKPDCEIIYAGKMTSNHTMPQDRINSLLSQKAKEGKIVCRLKGGDPFLFGRGGEEALFLNKEGVVFEVVPGVSAAISVPAYAGIPVTHRGVTSSFCAITGHEDPTKENSHIDWAKISTGIGTLVFFMGVKNLPVIAKKLMENGRAKETPVALVRNGATPTQFTVTGTLENIADIAKKAKMAPPALIIVGEAVLLRENLMWFEKRALFGKKIVVTRARAQVSDFSKNLENLGAQVIEFPTIKIDPPDNPDPLRLAASAISAYDWVILTSVNGVNSLMGAIHETGGDSRAFGRAKICAIGPATSKRLEFFGLVPDLVPAKYVAESVLEALGKQGEIKVKGICCQERISHALLLEWNWKKEAELLTKLPRIKQFLRIPPMVKSRSFFYLD